MHTGNGFTTGFLNLAPTHKFQSNIIIVPNREVVKSKKPQKYAKNGRFLTPEGRFLRN